MKKAQFVLREHKITDFVTRGDRAYESIHEFLATELELKELHFVLKAMTGLEDQEVSMLIGKQLNGQAFQEIIDAHEVSMAEFTRQSSQWLRAAAMEAVLLRATRQIRSNDEGTVKWLEDVDGNDIAIFDKVVPYDEQFKAFAAEHLPTNYGWRLVQVDETGKEEVVASVNIQQED